MRGAEWTAVASAVIASVAMIGSFVGWILARKEKTAAAEQAERATPAAETAADNAGRAADAAERSATAAESQERREAEVVSAADDHPWLLADPWSRRRYLINRTSTPKHGVVVSGFEVYNGPIEFDMIGGGKRPGRDARGAALGHAGIRADHQSMGDDVCAAKHSRTAAHLRLTEGMTS